MRHSLSRLAALGAVSALTAFSVAGTAMANSYAGSTSFGSFGPFSSMSYGSLSPFSSFSQNDNYFDQFSNCGSYNPSYFGFGTMNASLFSDFNSCGQVQDFQNYCDQNGLAGSYGDYMNWNWDHQGPFGGFGSFDFFNPFEEGGTSTQNASVNANANTTVNNQVNAASVNEVMVNQD